MKVFFLLRHAREKAGAIFGPRFILVALILLPLQSLQADSRNQAVIRAELFMQLEQLQIEVQNLRNQVERQERALALLQDQQAQRYLDLDERLQEHSKRLGDLEQLSLGSGSLNPLLEAPSVETEVASSSSGVSGQSGNDQEVYARAYALVPERRFDEAVKAFQDFIRTYPESRLVGNGYYWIGEIYLAQNRTRDAEKMFDAVVRRYPDSFKVADSLYKLGLIHARYGNSARARETMQSIIDAHPREPAANLARSWLERH